MRFKFWVCILIGSAFIPATHAQVFSWTNSVKGNFYKWEDGTKWLGGFPPSGFSCSAFITNNPTGGTGSGQTINIDATTAGSFASTMNIANLTVSTPSGVNRNTVLVSNTGSTTFHISQDLEVLSRCALTINNATLQVDNYSDVDGTLNIAGGTVTMSAANVGIALDIGAAPSSSGMVLLTGGLLDTTDSGENDVGDSGTGQMSVSNATWLSGSVSIGFNPGSQGTLTVANGGSVTANDLDAGSLGMGTVWLTGGQIEALGIILGNDSVDSVGIMTVSNGTCQLHSSMYIGFNGAGTLTLAGGLTTVAQDLGLGSQATATGTVWMTGGQLLVNENIDIGGNGPGTLTVAGGLITVGYEFDLGQFGGATGTVWMTGGQLLVGFDTLVGDAGVGQMTVSNGTWQSWLVEVASGFDDHSLGGTLVVAGGTNSVFHELMIGSLNSTTGTVTMTGGSLSITNAAHNAELDLESGTLTLSGGILTADVFVNTNPCCATFQQTGGILIVGSATISGGNLDIGFGSPGTLTVANNGSVTSDLYAGNSGTGTVWLTGGQIDASTAGLIILGAGVGGVGIMTVSNGTCQSYDALVGQNGPGTLTLAGGLTTVSNEFDVGDLAATGTVWMTGGQLVVGFDTIVGDAGVGQMIVSNGTWQSGFVEVGSGNGSRGILIVAGGTNSAYYGLSIGTPNCSGKGTVIVNGGSLFVTNAAHNAVLDLESGTLTLSGGTLAVDALVTNNSCGVFQHTGGTLIVGGITNLVSPLPFSITAISRNGNDIRITWQTPSGVTNVVQATNGGPGGSYGTNFVDLSPQFILTGSGAITTNYLDVGGATNTPSRYYRVRLVP